MQYFQFRNHILYLACCATLLFSCSTLSTVELDVLRPAVITVDPEVKSVGLINITDAEDEDAHSIEMMNAQYSLEGGVLKQNDIGVNFINGLYDELVNRNFYDTVIVIKDTLNIVNNRLSREQFDILCGESGVDMILALSKFQTHTGIYLYNNEFGLVSATYMGVVKARVLNYNKLFEEKNSADDQVDTFYVSRAGSTMDDVLSGIPNWGSVVEDFALYQGQGYANKFAPYWNKVEFVYYAGGNINLHRAKSYVASDEWGEAIKIWKLEYTQRKGVSKGRAAYNLAVASYALGDFMAADFWVNKSEEIFNSKGDFYLYDKKYISFLREEIVLRLAELDKIKEQYGTY